MNYTSSSVRIDSSYWNQHRLINIISLCWFKLNTVEFNIVLLWWRNSSIRFFVIFVVIIIPIRAIVVDTTSITFYPFFNRIWASEHTQLTNFSPVPFSVCLVLSDSLFYARLSISLSWVISLSRYRSDSSVGFCTRRDIIFRAFRLWLLKFDSLSGIGECQSGEGELDHFFDYFFFISV